MIPQYRGCTKIKKSTTPEVFALEVVITSFHTVSLKWKYGSELRNVISATNHLKKKGGENCAV